MSPSFAELVEGLATAGYIADEGTATAVQLALALDKPLLARGRAGRRQDLDRARALAAMLGRAADPPAVPRWHRLPARRSTNGTMPASSWRSAPPQAGAARRALYAATTT